MQGTESLREQLCSGGRERMETKDRVLLCRGFVSAWLSGLRRAVIMKAWLMETLSFEVSLKKNDFDYRSVPVLTVSGVKQGSKILKS